MKVIGNGKITLNISAQGELRVVTSIQDVISLWKEGAAGKIAIVEDAGTTTLGPILSKLAGVVCKTGGIGSHLAIVSREFSIPALMGTKIKTDEPLNKRQAVIKPNGGVEGLLLVSDS
jgi:phosphoenolpyruvate-protein kinase (PTS system EI component)